MNKRQLFFMFLATVLFGGCASTKPIAKFWPVSPANRKPANDQMMPLLASSKAKESNVLNCAGSEPFWSAKLQFEPNASNANTEIVTMEYKDGNAPMAQRSSRMSIFRGNNDMSTRFFGQDGRGSGRTVLGPQAKISAVLVDASARGYTCGEDDVQDGRQRYELFMTIDQKPRVGCCIQ